MTPPRGAEILSGLGEIAHQAGLAFVRVFLAPGSHFSLLSLAAALLIAAGFLSIQRLRRGRRVRLKVLARALFPRRVFAGPSTKADLGFFLFNLFLFGTLVGWAILTYGAVSHWVVGALDAALGPVAPTGLSVQACTLITTLALFLAYELAYWVDHWLSHKVPVLWEFHKVHHTAQALTPLTNFRVHPVDSVVFGNITALFMGLTAGLLAHLLGRPVSPFTVSGGNVILLAFIFLTVHLQHSHVWIAFTGVWGRIFVSPAHHQLHHSADPAHFDRNFGSCLALWDWMFGTLNLPTKARQAIVFGAPAEQPHGITGGLVTPFVEAWRRLAAPGGAAAGRAPARPRRVLEPFRFRWIHLNRSKKALSQKLEHAGRLTGFHLTLACSRAGRGASPAAGSPRAGLPGISDPRRP